MEGKVDLNGLRFRWELTWARAPQRCKLHVRFDELSVEREYPNYLSREQAEKEAARLVPELFGPAN